MCSRRNFYLSLCISERKMRRFILILILCAGAWGSSNAQVLSDYLSEARSGNSIAQYNAAMCYLHGWGTEQDLSRWHYFMRQAAEGGQQQASQRLADHYATFAPELAAYWQGKESTLPYKYHYCSYDQGCYYGELRSGMRDGYGTFVWDNGTYVVGYWEDGLQYGMCRIERPEQCTYGNFDNFCGTGAIVLSPGREFAGIDGAVVYVGYIEDGVPSGHGAFYDAQGHNIYLGYIEEGVPTEALTSENTHAYRWSHERLSSGDSWEGEVLNGMRHGFGIYRWADGAWWCGFWENGLREGTGLYRRADGALMTGIWSKDTLQ